MRIAAAIVAVVVVALVAGGAGAIAPGEARIRLTAEQTAPNTYALYNRPAYPDRIGTAVRTCDTVSRGWVDCSFLLRLGRGTIIARGLNPTAAPYQVLAVVGGTGYYANTGGEMTSQPVGTGQLLIVNLIAY